MKVKFTLIFIKYFYINFFLCFMHELSIYVYMKHFRCLHENFVRKTCSFLAQDKLVSDCELVPEQDQLGC